MKEKPLRERLRDWWYGTDNWMDKQIEALKQELKYYKTNNKYLQECTLSSYARESRLKRKLERTAVWAKEAHLSIKRRKEQAARDQEHIDKLEQQILDLENEVAAKAGLIDDLARKYNHSFI